MHSKKMESAKEPSLIQKGLQSLKKLINEQKAKLLTENYDKRKKLKDSPCG